MQEVCTINPHAAEVQIATCQALPPAKFNVKLRITVCQPEAFLSKGTFPNGMESLWIAPIRTPVKTA